MPFYQSAAHSVSFRCLSAVFNKFNADYSIQTETRMTSLLLSMVLQSSLSPFLCLSLYLLFFFFLFIAISSTVYSICIIINHCWLVSQVLLLSRIKSILRVNVWSRNEFRIIHEVISRFVSFHGITNTLCNKFWFIWLWCVWFYLVFCSASYAQIKYIHL